MVVKKPGEWNRMIVTAKGQQIDIELNGKHIVSANLADWTSGTTNPDGTEIPEWLPIPYANMPTKGYIGLQGKHGESNIWFRNIQLKQLLNHHYYETYIKKRFFEDRSFTEYEYREYCGFM